MAHQFNAGAIWKLIQLVVRCVMQRIREARLPSPLLRYQPVYAAGGAGVIAEFQEGGCHLDLKMGPSCRRNSSTALSLCSPHHSSAVVVGNSVEV